MDKLTKEMHEMFGANLEKAFLFKFYFAPWGCK